MATQTQQIEAVKKRPSILVPAAAIVGVLIVVWIVSSMRRSDLPVRATKVERQNISATISTNGKIEPVSNFEAHAPASTSVKKIYVREGDRVKAGQLLMQLDDADARANAARALAQLRSAEADLKAVQSGGTREEVITNQAELNRAQAELGAAQRNLDAVRKLQQTGAASPAELSDAEARLKNAQTQVNLLQQKTTNRYSSAELQRAQAALEQARAGYTAAEDQLGKSNIRSTVSGTVYSLPVKQGTFVNPGDPLIQVADLTKVMVRAFVDEPDIGRLAEGQPVKVTWDAVPGRTWQGTVTHIPSTVTMRGSRTVGEVTSQVENSDRRLLPNTNVSAVITTAKHESAMTVPREAVHQDEGGRYVLVVDNNKLKRQNVETSISNLTLIEVTNGLSDGAVIALGSPTGQNLREGLPVKVLQ
jgi:HlyD family secretion protein